MAAVRAALAERLPEYMVPAVLTELAELPKTPSGKLDRRALPVPDRTRPGGESGYVAPRDRWERVVSEVWGEVLGLDRVGTRDNFFDLGGHSVVLLKLQSKLAAATGVRLSVVQLFQHTTVTAQAKAVAEAADVLGLEGSETTTWSGHPIDASSVLVKYTYDGDANLDGKIDIDDYGRIDAASPRSGSVFGYANGDFNLDGKINVDDYGIIDFNVGIQGTPGGGVAEAAGSAAAAFAYGGVSWDEFDHARDRSLITEGNVSYV